MRETILRVRQLEINIAVAGTVAGCNWSLTAGTPIAQKRWLKFQGEFLNDARQFGGIPERLKSKLRGEHDALDWMVLGSNKIDHKRRQGYSFAANRFENECIQINYPWSDAPFAGLDLIWNRKAPKVSGRPQNLGLSSVHPQVQKSIKKETAEQ